MIFRKVLIHDDFFGYSTIKRQISSIDKNIVTIHVNPKELNDFKKTHCVHETLIIVRLSEYDISTIDLLKQLFSDYKKVILSDVPINIYYNKCNNEKVVGYLNRSHFNEKSISDLFIKINQNRVYISESDTDLLIQNSALEQKNFNLLRKLSDKEHLVYKHLVEGKRLKEIAVELNLHISSVATYKTRILNKCSVKNLAELIRMGNFL